MDNYNILISIGLSAILAFIPANIAKRKGYSFGLWWLYGWLLFIVAIIHVNVIKDKNSSGKSVHGTVSVPHYSPKQKNAKRYAVISGISLILYVIGLILRIFLQTTGENGSIYTPSISNILNWGIYIAIAVLIIMQRKNIALVVLIGVRLLTTLYWTIPYFEPIDAIYVLAVVSMFVLALFNSISKFRGVAQRTKSCWFVPGAILLVCDIIGWIHNGFYIGFDLVYLYLLMDVFELIAFWAAGLWICAGNGDIKEAE